MIQAKGLCEARIEGCLQKGLLRHKPCSFKDLPYLKDCAPFRDDYSMQEGLAPDQGVQDGPWWHGSTNKIFSSSNPPIIPSKAGKPSKSLRVLH